MLKYAIVIVVLMSFNCGHSSSDSKTELNSTNLRAIKKLEKKAKQPMDCEPLGFQFIEFSNNMLSKTIQKITVFMNPKAFSKTNLKKLFTSLSNRHSQSKNLVIKVYTDWSQVSVKTTPLDCPSGAAVSEMRIKPTYKYHEAIFYRRGKREFFRFNPVLNTSKFEKVIMKKGSAPDNTKSVVVNKHEKMTH